MSSANVHKNNKKAFTKYFIFFVKAFHEMMTDSYLFFFYKPAFSNAMQQDSAAPVAASSVCCGN